MAVIVQSDHSLSPENHTTKSRRHEEVKEPFSIFFVSLRFVVNSLFHAVNAYPWHATSYLKPRTVVLPALPGVLFRLGFCLREDLDCRTMLEIKVFPRDAKHVICVHFAYLLDVCRVVIIAQTIKRVQVRSLGARAAELCNEMK